LPFAGPKRGQCAIEPCTVSRPDAEDAARDERSHLSGIDANPPGFSHVELRANSEPETQREAGDTPDSRERTFETIDGLEGTGKIEHGGRVHRNRSQHERHSGEPLRTRARGGPQTRIAGPPLLEPGPPAEGNESVRRQ
jgi:hypothetical protein